jgi:hypothetical protein
MATSLPSLGDLFRQPIGTATLIVEDRKTTLAVIGGLTAAAGLTWYMTRPTRSYKKKPGTFEIGSGAVDRSKVNDEVREGPLKNLKVRSSDVS